jgi:arylsulfatase
MVEKMNPDPPAGQSSSKETRSLCFRDGRLSENCVLNIKNKSHSVAEIVVPEKALRRHHCPRRKHRRLESLPGRQTQVLLQLGRLQELLVEGNTLSPGEHQVRMGCLRGWRPRQGR